ncbi:MAG: response regulator [Pseudomonadota bacterium]
MITEKIGLEQTARVAEEITSPPRNTVGLSSSQAEQSPQNQKSLAAKNTRQGCEELQGHHVEDDFQNEELRRTKAELEDIRARYLGLYDGAPVGYCTISQKGQIIEANLTAATLLGAAKGELENTFISRFIVKEDQKIYALHSKQLLEQHPAFQPGSVQENSEQINKPQIYALRMVKNDGSTFWAQLEVTAVKVYNLDSTIDSAIVHRVMLSDITERKQAEAQRIILEDQTRQIDKAESLERMAGAIAHLFNNQLLVVFANLEIALDDMVGNTLPRQNLINAMQAARRSAETSSLLLTYLGQNNDKPEILDLSMMCHNILPKLQADIPGGITVETDLMTPGPVVCASIRQLQQVLSHLLTNGRDAIGDHTGRMTVATKTLPASAIPTTHIFPTDWQSSSEFFACLEVTDTGSGMIAQEIDKIFDPFFTTKCTGKGLGLAVVIGLVKAWNGMIGVESVVSKGSILRIFLPLCSDEVSQQAETLVEPWNFKTGWVVLLVDDDFIVRNLLENVLERLGLTVISAASGSEAIALFQKHQNKLDCLITDLSMPKMNGWETLTALRTIRPNLPVILCSGYDETQAMSGDYAERPQAFLHKPFKISELKITLKRVLGKRNQKFH